MGDDSQQKLGVDIEITSKTEGAKDASKALGDFDKDLTNLSPKTEKYIQGLEDQKKKEEETVASKGEVRRGLREIGRELPIVGELGRMAMEPLIGAFVLLASVVSAAFEGIKELGNRSTPEFQTLTEAVEKQKEAMEDVEIAARSYDRALQRLATSSETVSDNSKAYMDRFKSKSDAEIAQAEASQRRQSAILESAEKLGLITHQQYIQRRLALDDEYAAKRAAIENKLQQTQLTEKYRERANANIEANSLEKSLALKRDAAKKGQGESAFAGGQTEKDKKDLEATKEKIKKLQEEWGELHDKTTGLGRFHTMTPQYILETQKKQNETEQTGEEETADKLRRKIKQDQEREFNAKDTAKAAEEDLQDTEERLRKDRERVKDLDKELPVSTETTQRSIDTRNQVTAEDAHTRAIGALKDLPNALGSAQDMSKATPETLGALTTLLETTRKNQWDTLAMVKSHNGDISAITSAIADTNRELAKLREEMKSRLKGAYLR